MGKDEQNMVNVGVILPNLPLAQAYIPMQHWGGPLFDLDRALEVGTLFPELWRPYPH